MVNKLILVGKIVAAHGIKGQVKILSYTDPVDNLFNYTPILDEHGFEIKIKSASLHKNVFICYIDSVDDRNKAEALVSKELFCDIESFSEILDEDLYYIHELVDMRVLDKDLAKIGVVSAVTNFGAGDLIEVKLDNGQSDLYPFTKNIFTQVNKKERFLVFIPPVIL